MGLTIAETLLLVLFVLLLLFSVFFIKKNAEIEDKGIEIASLQKKLSQLTEENSFLVDLKRKIENSIGKDFDNSFEELKLAQKTIEQNKNLINEITVLKTNLEETKKSIEKFEAFNKEMKKAVPDGKDVLEYIAEIMSKLNEFEKDSDKQDIVSTLKNIQQTQKKNFDLKKQIDHLVKVQKGLGKGADYPPCWLDTENKIEYIFNVVLNDNGVLIYDIKNKSRSEEKAELPIQDLSYNENISTARFLKELKPLYDLCVKENCRHFVKIFDHTTKKNTFKKNLLTVESYFYKYLTNVEFHVQPEIETENQNVGSLSSIN